MEGKRWRINDGIGKNGGLGDDQEKGIDEGEERERKCADMTKRGGSARSEVTGF